MDHPGDLPESTESIDDKPVVAASRGRRAEHGCGCRHRQGDVGLKSGCFATWIIIIIIIITSIDRRVGRRQSSLHLVAYYVGFVYTRNRGRSASSLRDMT